MARTQAQNEWRKEHKQIQVRIEVTEETRNAWRAYAVAQGLPMGTMIRRAVERAMQTDCFKLDDTKPNADG